MPINFAEQTGRKRARASKAAEVYAEPPRPLFLGGIARHVEPPIGWRPPGASRGAQHARSLDGAAAAEMARAAFTARLRAHAADVAPRCCSSCRARGARLARRGSCLNSWPGRSNSPARVIDALHSSHAYAPTLLLPVRSRRQDGDHGDSGGQQVPVGAQDR